MMDTKEKNMSKMLDNLNKKSIASGYESPIIPVRRDPEELENDPKFIMSNDERIKKSSIYHPPVKSSYIPTSTLNSKCKEMAGDQYKYTLGVPMTWNEFMAISDDAKRIYINDLLEKYPGISYGVIARFMGSGWKSVKRVLDGIGIKQWKFVGNKTQMVYSRRLEEKAANSDKPNLEIIRRNEIGDLPRYSYKELMKWNDDNRVKTYIQNVLDKYNKALTIHNMAELLQCAPATISKLYKKYDIELISNYTKSGPSKEYKELFKKEMLSKPCNTKPRKYTKHSKTTTDDSIYGRLEIEKNDTADVSAEDASQKLFDELVDCVKEAEKKASSHMEEKKSDIDISMIEFTSDVMDVSYILNKYGFTGKVKIRVEKI